MQLLQSTVTDANGQKIRIPLDHHETDLVDKRIHNLLSLGGLSDDDFGNLLKKRHDLRIVDRRLARRLFDRPLPRTGLRPKFWDDAHRPMSDVFGHAEIDVWAGWVRRLQEYVLRLERRYGGGSIGDDDDI
jgi:hypothetical protein